MQLQELRYRSAITLRIHVDKEAEQAMVPKFLIQPLVENSIIHGLNEEGKSITIKLSVTICDEKLVISIKDDGAGFDPMLLNRYLDGEKDIFPEEKIGIYNIHKRIKNKFGNGFGLHYKKEENRLVAEITLPVLRQEASNN